MHDSAVKMLSAEELDAIWVRATARPAVTFVGAVEAAREAIQDRVDLLSHIAAVQAASGSAAIEGVKLMADIRKLQELVDDHR